MTENKKLQRLSRAELLELLLAQTREAELLRDRLEKADVALAERHIRISNAGDLAHAVLEVNNVMDAAQAAAQQYLDNIALMYQEAEKTCVQMIQQARQEAERVRGEIIDQANRDAEQIRREAFESLPSADDLIAEVQSMLGKNLK